MSVFGLDFGDESLTVAAFRNNTIDVLQNEIGKRKTRAMVSYHARQRFVADDAISHYLSNSANTVVYIKRIIGKWFSDPDVAHEQKFIPAKLVPDADGRVAIAVRHLDKDVVVTPEEVVATLLAKIKQTCVASVTDFAINDCVIAVPHYFNDTQYVLKKYYKMTHIATLTVLNQIQTLCRHTICEYLYHQAVSSLTHSIYTFFGIFLQAPRDVRRGAHGEPQRAAPRQRPDVRGHAVRHAAHLYERH